jgi:hypothetical protein
LGRKLFSRTWSGKEDEDNLRSWGLNPGNQKSSSTLKRTIEVMSGNDYRIESV